MKKSFFFGILIVFFLLGVGILYFVFFHAQPAPRESILLGVDFSDMFSTPVLIAESQGYFRKEGLDVKIIEYPSGRTALVDMVEKGGLDVVTAAQTPTMYNSFEGNRYAIIAGMASSYENGSLLLARQDKGIKTPQDLKGKKIGTPVGSTGHFFLHLFLIYAGLQIANVQIVDIDTPKLPDALAEGRVDAISVWQPQIYDARQLLRDKAIILANDNIYRVDFYLIAHRDCIKNKPQSLIQLLKAIQKAEEFIRLNQGIAMNIIMNRLKLDRATTVALWGAYQFKMFLDQAIITDLEAEARWAIKNKYTFASTIPDYRTFIYDQALTAIEPEAVNLITVSSSTD